MSILKSKAKGFVDVGFAFRAKYLDSEDAKFFRDGFGDTAATRAFETKIFEEGDAGFEDVDFDKIEQEKYSTETYKSYRGTFLSPASEFIMDETVAKAEVEILEPVIDELAGVVILLPMTGDEGYGYRRKNLAQPLAEAGFVSISLIIPFYGKRRPLGAKSCYARTFHEFSLTYWSAFLEAGKLVKWAKQAYPGVNVGISGLSQGGIMTVNGSTYTLSDVVLVPAVAGLRLYDALREGVLSATISKKSIKTKQDVEELDNLMKMETCERYILAMKERGVPQDRKVTIRLVTARNDRFISNSSSKNLANVLEDYATQFAHVRVNGGHATTIKDAKALVVPEIIRAFEDHARA